MGASPRYVSGKPVARAARPCLFGLCKKHTGGPERATAEITGLVQQRIAMKQRRGFLAMVFLIALGLVTGPLLAAAPPVVVEQQDRDISIRNGLVELKVNTST